MYDLIDEHGEEIDENVVQKLCRKAVNIKQKNLVLFIVFIALLLDNILLTVIVPIIPEFLWEIKHGQELQMICANKTFIKNVDTFHYRKQKKLEEKFSFDKNKSYPCVEIFAQNKFMNMSSETVEIALMFASKPFIQLLINPIIGPITNRIGYTVPMFVGFVVLFISTIVFAFAQSYGLLCFARSFQGIGSACSSVSGMGMLATFFPDDKERGEAFGFALSGLALGVLIGPSFGGILYEYTNKETPFIILAAMVFLDGVLQLTILRPSIKPEPQKGATLKSLLMDPYILVAASTVTIGNMGIAVLEPSLPIWIKTKMNASRLEQGLVFIPFSLSYLFATNLFGNYGHRIGRWLASFIGLILIATFLLIIPLAKDIPTIIFPGVVIGFAIGMVDASILPIMGYLVDIRHVSVYGTVYAIADVAFCVGFVTGPTISGALIEAVGFQWMLTIAALVCFMFAPLIILLRNPPPKVHDKTMYLKDQCPAHYRVTIKQTPDDLEDSNIKNVFKSQYGYEQD